MSRPLLRRKVVEKHGISLTIAPLTLAQVEEWIAPLEDVVPEKRNIMRAYDLCLNGLNNALEPGEKVWTRERLRDEIDMPLFRELQDQILIISGFKQDPETVPGESAAASANNSPDVPPTSSPSSTSGTSAAA
jgi:hypothetical protein